VTGIERNEESVSLARRFLAEHKLGNANVIHGDGRATGLPRTSFDFVIARLLLVNVPQPEQIIVEMVALVQPGGIVALYEGDWMGVFCEPPLPAWTRLTDLCHQYASMHDIDLFAGRKTPRMLREAGLVDIQVEPLIRMCPQGHLHRTLLPCFVENLRERLLAQGITSEEELSNLLNELKRHLDDPHTLVFGGLFFKTWGRRPVP
jgi:SAM-dependent methyltransferase